MNYYYLFKYYYYYYSVDMVDGSRLIIGYNLLFILLLGLYNNSYNILLLNLSFFLSFYKLIKNTT